MIAAESIETMEAGPELDALVAERVFAWKPRRFFVPRPDDVHLFEESSLNSSNWLTVRGYCRHRAEGFLVKIGDERPVCLCGERISGELIEDSPRPYSTDDAAALEVLKALPAATIQYLRLKEGPVYSVVTPYLDDSRPESYSRASTFALAICRAALRAVAAR